jgi:hypothetical protein
MFSVEKRPNPALLLGYAHARRSRSSATTAVPSKHFRFCRLWRSIFHDTCRSNLGSLRISFLLGKGALHASSSEHIVFSISLSPSVQRYTPRVIAGSMDLHISRENAAFQISLSDVPKAVNRVNRCGNGAHHSLPKRSPLRCIQDDPNLLQSPGPLESMLKTTTETGDIGIFTIKPSIVPSTYHQPPRPRPGLADANLLQASRSRYYREVSNRDDRKRLPSSYRDTTSEILSLYGSETQRSLALIPSDDDERRSYSMTTNSSRKMPSHKSSMTLQSQFSAPGLQRPRSPFPYPTRLRRPGVRAASPALTENSDVDYTRMVHLDRPAQRTVHGSYRPMYSQTPRRGLPTPLRAGVNGSTASLPCRSSPGTYFMGSSHSSPRTLMDGPVSTHRTLERP